MNELASLCHLQKIIIIIHIGSLIIMKTHIQITFEHLKARVTLSDKSMIKNPEMYSELIRADRSGGEQADESGFRFFRRSR